LELRPSPIKVCSARLRGGRWLLPEPPARARQSARLAEAGEAEADRTAKLHEGFLAHYGKIAHLVRQEARRQSGRDLPLLLTGHLYLTGARLSDERSERAQRIGNLGALPADLLPDADYCALGHLHTPQRLGQGECCRYSGSPLPMSFGEAGQEKSVAVVEFGPQTGGPVSVRLVPVPVFQRLERVQGSPERIETRLRELLATGASIWVEVQVTAGEGDLGPFWNSLPRLVEDSQVRSWPTRTAAPS
jgi:exonuclease SbcD